MNAGQFFDVWMTSACRVEAARRFPSVSRMQPDLVKEEIGIRHGPRVAEEAVAYYRRLLEDAKKGGVR